MAAPLNGRRPLLGVVPPVWFVGSPPAALASASVTSAVTEGPDTSAGSFASTAVADSSIAEGLDTGSGTIVTSVAGTSSVTEGVDASVASVSAGSVGITISGASTDGFDTAAAQLEATATVTSTIVESQETPAGVITPVSALVGQGTEGSDSGMASLASTVTILSSLVEGSDASASALQQQLPGRSHSPQRNQQWLVDYYTEAFKKKAVAPTPAVGRKVTRRTSERVAEEQGAALLAKVERAVTRARSDIDRLTAQVTDRAEVQRIDDVLRAAAVNSHKTIVNFMLIELNYRQSESRRDEELMLFALDLLPTGNSTPLSVGDAELSLLAHIL